MSGFRRGLSLLAGVVLGVPLVLMTPANAALPSAAASPPSASHRVTLLTGDVVDYTETSDGHRTVAIEASTVPERSSVAFQTASAKDGMYVYPTDALGAINSGAVDRTLFNVTELVREGLDDTSAKAIPVIVTYPDAPSLRSMASAALPAATRGVTIAALPGVGMRIDRAHTGDFWRSIAPQTGAVKPMLQRGLSRVLLDRKSHVTLDQSAPQIGAPAAWAAGLDGTGTTVGIVDSGIDTTHPDLAGAVTDSANFTSEPDITDGIGHGTHVASIIAGTGKASNGRYKGIAPGAKLVVAKVFDSTGYGEDSQVMAGMEWVAAHGAKVANLSLGSTPTDGTDPVCQFLDSLTDKYGTLFVVAAGNEGPNALTVDAPGAAAKALTVGAVDKQDKLAGFSSRGPRLGDAFVKPEIAAPGVNIVAARAAGTSMGAPVNDFYTSASGTSMATPHVSGAAAILAGQHPAWTAGQLKDTLVSTAKDDGLKWFEQGAGRLDVGRAVSQPVTGTGALDFGVQKRGVTPVARSLTYVNSTDTAITLAVSASTTGWNGKPSPTNAFTLGAATITVPANGQASTNLVAANNIGDPGVYGGVVVATSTDGRTVVRTALSVYEAPLLYPLTVHFLDSAGNPAPNALAQLISDTAATTVPNDPFTSQPRVSVPVTDGVATAQVPAGTYSILGTVTEQSVTSRKWYALSASELTVKGSAEVTLDARKAVPVTVTSPTPTDQRDRTVMLRRVLPGCIGEFSLTAGGKSWQVFATPAPATKTGVITLQDVLSLQQATVDMRAGDTALHPEYDAFGVETTWAGEHRLPVVFAGQGTAADFAGLDVKGKAALVRLPDPSTAGKAADAAAKAGAAAVLSYVDAPGALTIPGLTTTTIAQLSLNNAEGERLRQQPVELSVHVRKSPDAMYDLSYLDRNGIPADHNHIVDPGSLVAVPTDYHADKPGLTANKQWYAFPTGLWQSEYLAGTKVALPGSWTEYIGPGDNYTAWKRVVTLAGTDSKGQRAALSVYRDDRFRSGEASRPTEDWFQAPMHSQAVELQADDPARYPDTGTGWRLTCTACRGGTDPDLFIPALQWGDSTPGHFSTPADNSQYFTTTTARLFSGNTEIPRSNAGVPFALYPTFELSPDPTTYRLEVSDVQSPTAKVGTVSATLFTLAPRTDTTWTFTSRRSANPPPTGYSCVDGGACSFQPLIQLGYQFDLGLDNTAPAGNFAFQVSAASHTGAQGGGPIVGLHMSYSTDEGKTWLQATTSPSQNGVWSATVTNPAAGYVWLRTDARDSTGNTVSQTVQRAYAVKG